MALAIDRALQNPVYTGLLKVAPYKEYSGGLFQGIHEPIIDMTTWKMVQEKIKRPDKTRTVIDDGLPLRGLLKCHCGTPLSGAPSRGKSGKYYNYYKCRYPKHNNISEIKSQEQFLKACELMSLPNSIIKNIKENSEKLIEIELKNNRQKVIKKKEEIEEIEEIEHNLHAVEEKWIRNEIAKETYERWYSTYNNSLNNLRDSIERLSINHNKAFDILKHNLSMLNDMSYVYSVANTLQKREFVNIVFDGNLYYQNGIYRTPKMLEIFSHKHLKMKQKGLLVYKKRGTSSRSPS